MAWIGRIIKSAATTISKNLNKSKPTSKTAQSSKKPQQKISNTDKQEQQKKPAYEAADKARKELKEKGGGSYPVEDVKGHDGSRPNTPSTDNGNSNSGGNYDPPREPPRSSYRGKSQDKGRSL